MISLNQFYQPNNHVGQAQQLYQGAGNAAIAGIRGKQRDASLQQQHEAMQPADPTVGGGMMAGAGGAMAASQMGSALTEMGHADAGAAVGGPKGMAVGAGLAALAHFLG